MNNIHSALISHVWFTNAMNTNTQNVYNFCFHGNGAIWLSEILQNTAILAMQIILFLQTEIWNNVNTFWQVVHMCLTKQKSKIMKLYKYGLPWQQTHQIVSYFTKRALTKQNISPKQRIKLII